MAKSLPTEKQIEERLKLHVLNLCLAVAGKKEGDIRTVKGMLYREVVRIVHDHQPHPG